MAAITETRYFSISGLQYGEILYEARSDCIISLNAARVSIGGTVGINVYAMGADSPSVLVSPTHDAQLDVNTPHITMGPISLKKGGVISGSATLNGESSLLIHGVEIGAFAGDSSVDTYGDGIPPGYKARWTFANRTATHVLDETGDFNLSILGTFVEVPGVWTPTIELTGPQGNNRLVFAEPVADFPWTPFVVSFFMKYDPITGKYGRLGWGVSDDWNDSRRRFWAWTDTDGLHVRFGQGNPGQSVEFDWALSLPAGKTWVHVLALNDGVDSILYIDGVETETKTAAIRSGDLIAFIGGLLTTSAYNPILDGVDELIWYDTDVTNSAQLINLSKQPGD